MSPARFRTLVVVTGAALALIIFSGAAVRLTDSGLGCEDWPTCSDDQLVPEWSFHGWIEFGNRLISGVVGLLVIFTAVAAHRRVPRRADLVHWSLGLVAGVAAQIVLGGITVFADLHPSAVIAHFLLSIVLMWNVIVLWSKAGGAPGPPTPKVDGSRINHSRLVVAAATAVIISGTIVTGTGPNGGDSRADRLSLDLEDVVRAHSLTAWLLLLLIVALAVRVGPTVGLRRLLVLTVCQGGIGYAQYALGVPPGLVELHVVGAVSVWSGALIHHLSLFDRGAEPGISTADEPASVGQT